jgi:hypothetical protein
VDANDLRPSDVARGIAAGDASLLSRLSELTELDSVELQAAFSSVLIDRTSIARLLRSLREALISTQLAQQWAGLVRWGEPGRWQAGEMLHVYERTIPRLPGLDINVQDDDLVQSIVATLDDLGPDGSIAAAQLDDWIRQLGAADPGA